MANGNCNPLFPRTLTSDEVQRFWSMVDQSGGPNACWPWKGILYRNGYGHFRSSGHVFAAHRMALFLHCGIDHAPKHTCHRCDNRACCNGSHLFPATCAENHADMVKKLRHTYGEGQKTAVLNNEQVRTIRDMWAGGAHSQREIGQRFGVGQPLISMIVNRRRWQLLV